MTLASDLLSTSPVKLSGVFRKKEGRLEDGGMCMVPHRVRRRVSRVLAIVTTSLIPLIGIFPASSAAAPRIDAGPATIVPRTQATISGLGFGIKSPAAPLKWDRFEAGSSGASIAGWSFATPDHPSYSNAQSHSGAMSAYCDFTSPVYNRGFFLTGSYTKLYIDFWHRWSATGDASRQFKVFDLNGWPPCVESFAGETYFVAINWQSAENGGNDPVNLHNQNISETPANQWNHYEAYIDVGSANTSNGSFVLSHNSIQQLNYDGNIQMQSSSDSCSTWRAVQFGMYYAHDPGGNGQIWYDDIYIDTTRARVMISNNASWTSATHREVQIPVSWTDTSITFEVNEGSFAVGENVYIFAIDANGGVSNGLGPVRIGASGGGGDQLIPMAPSMRGVQAAGL